MAALKGIPSDLRAILAAHVALELVDRRRLQSTHNVESHGLMRVAAQAADLEIAIPRVQRVAEGGGRLRRSLVAKHPLVPRLAGELVGLLARLTGALGRRADRRAIDALAGFGAHCTEDAPRGAYPASRYRLRWIIEIHAKGGGGTRVSAPLLYERSRTACWRSINEMIYRSDGRCAKRSGKNRTSSST
jgi:hypothetical protein